MESISIREAAERLGVSHKVIRRLIKQGSVSARKVRGNHGDEWAVDPSSLESARAETPRATGPGRPSGTDGQGSTGPTHPAVHASAGPAREVDTLREDKRFLQRQVESLTALLGQAIGPGMLSHFALTGSHTAEPAALSPMAPEPGFSMEQVTSALQSSLHSIGTDDIAALEMCSVKVLWGKPVLWRVVASHPEDVDAMLGAILAPDAVWDAPGEEVVFLWAVDAEGSVVWGAACGPRWFGEPFETALRAARVERR